MALNIVRMRIFWISNIFVIIVIPYTHDTGAVTTPRNQAKIQPFDNLMGYILSISMCMQNFIPIFRSVQDIAPLSLFFRIWSSAKPRPMKNVISQSLGLDLVNINVYATIHQNISLSLRDRVIFTF